MSNGLVAQGTLFQTEYYIFKGESSGPIVFLNGGIHGDEVAGIKAAEYFKNIHVIKGTLILVPKMNKIACEAQKRYMNKELNHCFPGNKNSQAYEDQLAAWLTAFVGEQRPALTLSLHESRNHRLEKKNRSGGQVIYYGVKEQPPNLRNALRSLNANLIANRHFIAIYYPVSGACSEVWTQLFGGEAYAVETWRGYPLEERVALHIKVVKAFLSQVGIEFQLH